MARADDRKLESKWILRKATCSLVEIEGANLPKGVERKRGLCPQEGTMPTSDMTGQEKQLVAWLADMNEDDAYTLANRILLEEGAHRARCLTH
jgi:hypothetical protein